MEVGVKVVKLSRLTVGETGNCDDCGDVMGIAKERYRAGRAQQPFLYVVASSRDIFLWKGCIGDATPRRIIHWTYAP